MNKRDHFPCVLFGEPALPRRHARHANSVLNDPDQLGVSPTLYVRRCEVHRGGIHRLTQARVRTAISIVAEHAVLHINFAALLHDLRRYQERVYGLLCFDRNYDVFRHVRQRRLQS